MKNLIQVLFCICLFSTLTTAQNSIAIGLRAGINASTLRAENIVDYGERAYVKGVVLALPVEIGITSKFFVQPELQYIIKGYRINSESSEEYSALYNKYLEIPVLAKYKFGNERFKFYLAAGPSVGYLTGVTWEFRFIGPDAVETIKSKFDLSEEPYKTTYKRIEIGAAVGFGIELVVGNGSVFLDVRHNMDFNPNNSNQTIDGVTDEITNTGYSLCIGYLHTLMN